MERVDKTNKIVSYDNMKKAEKMQSKNNVLKTELSYLK